MKSNFSDTEHNLFDDHAWSACGRLTMLERWANELRTLVEKGGDVESWPLVGRAAMIIHDDPTACRTMLAHVARASGMKLINVDSDTLIETLRQDAIPQDWLPGLVYVPLGSWSVAAKDNAEIQVFQEQLATLLTNIDPSIVLVVATSGTQYNELAEPLRSPGAFDRQFVVPRQSMEDIGVRFLEKVGKGICDASLLGYPGKVGMLLEMNFDDARRQGLLSLAMRRLNFREQRQIHFKDLVFFATYGTEETDVCPSMSVDIVRAVAIHEAGHVLVSLLDSAGKNIPDYVSIIPSQKTRGVVSDSYAYHYSLEGRLTYRDSRHQIRVALAGRAAEEIVLGLENVGTWSARADLINATNQAKEIVGLCGFPSDLEDDDFTRTNLLTVNEQSTFSEVAHIEAQARIFLSRQYEANITMIRSRRELLDTITERLLVKRVLDQADVAELWQGIGMN